MTEQQIADVIDRIRLIRDEIKYMRKVIREADNDLEKLKSIIDNYTNKKNIQNATADK